MDHPPLKNGVDFKVFLEDAQNKRLSIEEPSIIIDYSNSII